MKKTILSFFLVTILGTSFGQAKTEPIKPFKYDADEANANRIFYLLSQIKAIVPKSKVPSDEGEAMKSNADSVLLDMHKQYQTWLAANKKDSAGKK